MPSTNPRRTGRILVTVVALVILLAITILVSLHLSEPRAKVPSHATGTETSNAVGVATGNTKLGVATNSPSSFIEPGVAELLQLMQAWRQRHPNYRLVVETSGPDLSSTAEVFRFVSPQGTTITRMKTQMQQPVALSFIMEAEGERVRAYFPSLEQVAVMNPEQETTRFLTQIGWAGDSLDGTLPIRLARASFVERGPDYRALTMVFPGSLFKMPPAAGDLFLTIQLDDTGKALSLEQLTLGMRVVSKLKYLDEDPTRIQEASPQIPATAVATKKTFKDILQEQAHWMNPTPAKPI